MVGVQAGPGVVARDVDPAEVGLDAGRLARIDRRLARYVDDGLLPGWLVLVSRHGRIAHLSTYGQRDVEAGLPVETDTVFRIYSMTKPVTTVAAMMLYEEGAFELKDPVSAFLPAFRDLRVYRGGDTIAGAVTEPAVEPMRLWHLLTHTSGLTYGFHRAHPVDAMYREAGFEWGQPAGFDLAACCDAWAGLPLLFEPGAEWNYSVSTDVLGRIVEVVAGMPLDRFLAERICGPLGMVDTGFGVRPDNAGRLAALYTPAAGTRLAVRNDAMGRGALHTPRTLLGGGGLVSTAADYHRFTQLLLNGGAYGGVRLLGPRTVDYLRRNHLPGGVDLTAYGRPLFSETTFDGVGFGLGFATVIDPAATRTLTPAGAYSWGGAASTGFWIDPANGITGILMTQLLPSSTWPLRTQLGQLVYQAVVD